MTLIRPLAPTAMAARARLSSPDSRLLPAGRLRAISPIWARLPLDSFRPTSWGFCQSWARVAGARFCPVRPGTL